VSGYAVFALQTLHSNMDIITSSGAVQSARVYMEEAERE